MTQNCFSNVDQGIEPNFEQIYTSTDLPQLGDSYSTTTADDYLLLDASLENLSELRSGADSLSVCSLLKMFIGLH